MKKYFCLIVKESSSQTSKKLSRKRGFYFVLPCWESKWCHQQVSLWAGVVLFPWQQGSYHHGNPQGGWRYQLLVLHLEPASIQQRPGQLEVLLPAAQSAAWGTQKCTSEPLHYFFDCFFCLTCEFKFSLSDVQVVPDSYRHCPTVKDMGNLWVSSSDGRSTKSIICWIWLKFLWPFFFLPRENCTIGMATSLPCMPNISASKWNLMQK